MESHKLKDYYAVLGVSAESSTTEIKKAYRALAHRYHPDRVAAGDESAQASERMVEINEAFAILSDVNRRAKLDRDLAAKRAPAAPEPAAADWEFPLAPSKGPEPRPTKRNAAVERTVADELFEKMKTQLLSEASGAKLREESAPGWLWLLQGRGWGANYCVALRKLPILNPSTVREMLNQIQAVVAKLRSSWKKNFFVVVLPFEGLSERDTVLKLLRTYCSREDNSTTKNLVNIIAFDLRQRQSVLCGKRTGDDQHNAILRALSS